MPIMKKMSISLKHYVMIDTIDFVFYMMEGTLNFVRRNNNPPPEDKIK